MGACPCRGTRSMSRRPGHARALVLACAAAAAVALVTHVRAQPACTYASSGVLTGVPYYLAVTYLTPGLPDWRVSVPVPQECAQGYVSGEEAIVCDLDVQPNVRIVDRSVLVRRTGWLQGYATVNITVFCVFPYAPYSPYTLSNGPTIPPRLPNMPTAVPNVSPVYEKILKHPSTTATPMMKPRSITQPVNESTSSAEPSSASGESSSSSQEERSVNRRMERWRLDPQRLLENFMKYVRGH